jgi:predicted HTH domain antitoxin
MVIPNRIQVSHPNPIWQSYKTQGIVTAGFTGHLFSTSVIDIVSPVTNSVQVPEALAKALHLDGPQLNRRALEALALDGYRTGELSRGQVSELLDLELNETMGFLKEHGCTHSLSIEEFERESP